MKRRSFVLLLVLAFAVAGVGFCLFGTLIMFGPSGVESAAKVAGVVTSTPIQLVEDAAKPDEQTLDIKEAPSILGISNYPMIELGATRYTKDAGLIDRACELLKGRTFKRWSGYASYRQKAIGMVGGCQSSIELDAADGTKICNVSYDPGYEGNEGPGIFILDDDIAYVMEGDQTELNDFMGQCIQDAYEQTCLPDPQTARDSGSARTWLFEDEVPEPPSEQESISISSSSSQ